MRRERPLTRGSKVVELKKEHGEVPITGLKVWLLLEMLSDQVQLSSKKSTTTWKPTWQESLTGSTVTVRLRHSGLLRRGRV